MKRAGLVLSAVVALAFFGAAQAGDDKEPKWVQLFNGKDLAGWKAHPDDKAKWEVKDGNIIGTGPAGNLFSERGDYENFHVRFEAKINDKGNSGLYFRAKYSKAFPDGYEAQINSNDPTSKVLTGSLFPTGRDKYSDEERKKLIVLDQLVKPETWFTTEVIAVGNHIVIKVNGKTTVDFVDEKNRHARGYFAIQHQKLPKDGGRGTVVTLRKIEVKELPPSKSDAQGQGKRLDRAALEALMTRLGLDEAQKGKLLAIKKDFDKKISATSSAFGIWGAYHREDLLLQKMLTDKQRLRHAEALSAMRPRELQGLAKTLDLSDDQRQRIAELRNGYEPKFVKLILPTQEGRKLSDEERQGTHKLVVAMRADFLKAVHAELTEAQRERLPVILGQIPGLPSYIPEGDALAYVLLAATLAHFSQSESLGALTTTLELSAPQKEEFQKVGANLDLKLKAARAQFAAAFTDLARMERDAMAKVLTDEQRTRWREMHKAKGEDK